MPSWLRSGLAKRLALVFALTLAASLAASAWWLSCSAGALSAAWPTLLWIAAAAMAAGTASALLLARAAFEPLLEITRAAEELAAGKLQTRVRRNLPGEYGQLAETLNLLADRIQGDLRRLKALEEVRKDFVANVSHELRTPLAAIKAFAETLEGGAAEDPEHRTEFIKEIGSNAERMSRLVDDLLELSALESGKNQPVFEPLSLMKAASEAVATVMPLAQKKGVVIRVEPAHDLPDIQGDRHQLKQVFLNLLSNAVKFTGEKGTVWVSAERRGGQVAVLVKDNGVGIPKDDLPRIFERFYRVDKARSRELGGTGLGLAIVKHIVEAHGGSVAVESDEGNGSTFRVSFPL